jgi:hypothetical protein
MVRVIFPRCTWTIFPKIKPVNQKEPSRSAAVQPILAGRNLLRPLKTMPLARTNAADPRRFTKQNELPRAKLTACLCSL